MSVTETKRKTKSAALGAELSPANEPGATGQGETSEGLNRAPRLADIFDPDQYPRELLAENVNAWNCAHRRLMMERLRQEIDSDRLKARKKALQEAFNALYGTHPEDGVSEDCAPLLDGLEPTGDPGTLKIELDLSSGALAAAQLFPQVKDRLTQQEYLDWTRAFLDTGDEILGTK